MVFGFPDLVAALAVNTLRFENLSAEPLKRVVEFLRSEEGATLAQELAANTGKQEREPRVLLVTENGVAVDTTPGELMKKEKAVAVYCLDAQHLVSELWLASTQAFMRFEFQEPGPSGRVPRKQSQATPKRATVQRTRETARKASNRTRRRAR